MKGTGRSSNLKVKKDRTLKVESHPFKYTKTRGRKSLIKQAEDI